MLGFKKEECDSVGVRGRERVSEVSEYLID